MIRRRKLPPNHLARGRRRALGNATSKDVIATYRGQSTLFNLLTTNRSCHRADYGHFPPRQTVGDSNLPRCCNILHSRRGIKEFAHLFADKTNGSPIAQALGHTWDATGE